MVGFTGIAHIPAREISHDRNIKGPANEKDHRAFSCEHPRERKCQQHEMKQYTELNNLQQKGKDERTTTMILVGRRYHEVQRWERMMGS